VLADDLADLSEVRLLVIERHTALVDDPEMLARGFHGHGCTDHNRYGVGDRPQPTVTSYPTPMTVKCVSPKVTKNSDLRGGVPPRGDERGDRLLQTQAGAKPGAGSLTVTCGYVRVCTKREPSGTRRDA